MMLPFYNLDTKLLPYSLCSAIIFPLHNHYLFYNFLVQNHSHFHSGQTQRKKKIVKSESGLLFCFSSKPSERGYLFEQPRQEAMSGRSFS